MTIGIEDFRTEQDLRLDQMLIQPFRPAKTRLKRAEPDHDLGTV